MSYMIIANACKHRCSDGELALLIVLAAFGVVVAIFALRELWRLRK